MIKDNMRSSGAGKLGTPAPYENNTDQVCESQALHKMNRKPAFKLENPLRELMPLLKDP
jgi:hypothetical protein